MTKFMIEETQFDDWSRKLDELLGKASEISLSLEKHNPNKVYNTKALMEYLQVGEKCIRRYREEGLLRYHKAEDSDKIWYLQQDVDDFLTAITVPAYRIDALDIPVQVV